MKDFCVKIYRTAKRFRYSLLSITLFITVLLLSLQFGFFNNYSNRVYPNVYLNGQSLQGVYIDKLDTVVDQISKDVKRQTVTFTYNDINYKYTYEDLGVILNEDDIKEEIEEYFYKIESEEKEHLKKGESDKNFKFEIKFDEEKKNAIIAKLEEKVNIPKKEPELNKAEDVFVYKEGENGVALNTVAISNKIEKVITSEEIEEIIDLAVDEIPTDNPTIKELSQINAKLSEYTTTFNNGKDGTSKNIVLAAERLNGTVILPGEEFSFADVAIAPYGKNEGYFIGSVFVNGGEGLDYGGGICQVSSTLYMAQLKAGLSTVERRQHGFAVNYVPMGLDAAVDTFTMNYRFKNDYNYAIYISSVIDGNKLHIEIWSNNEVKGTKAYEPKSSFDGTKYNAYLYEYDNGNYVSKKYLDSSMYRPLPDPTETEEIAE